MHSPKYSHPPGLFAQIMRDVLLMRPRDFHADAKACVENLRPPMRVSGTENIPQHGPCVITINHYHRPGFGAQWLAFAVSALLPIPVRWVMTNEFTDWGKRYGAGGTIASRIVLKRIAHIYDFTTMPPMPPRPGDVAARAASVRSLLAYIGQTQDPVIGLAPEGHDVPGGVLTRPARGLGRLGVLLAKAGLLFCPVGAYEESGYFHINFGEAYRLRVSSALAVDQKDTYAMQIIMKQIACLVPVHLQGEFA